MKEEQTAAYSVEIWKRFRKWGGIPTVSYTHLDVYKRQVLTDEDVMDILKQACSQSGMKEIVAESVKGRVAGESLTE